MASPPRSLKSRALRLLAQRDQSRVELRRKLLAHALSDDAAGATRSTRAVRAGGVAGETGAAGFAESDEPSAGNVRPPGLAGGADTSGQADASSDAELPGMGSGNAEPDSAATRVEAVLAWLEANRFLCDERFAESRAHARASRFGNLRIRQELKQHGVALSTDTAQALRDTEQARAIAVWERHFGQAPQTAAESAKQSRFLTARGFSPDTVRRTLRLQRSGAGDASTSDE